MSKYMDGKSIQDIREEERRQTFERMKRRQQLEAEQRARTAAEEEAAKLSPAEETKQLLSQLRDKADSIVTGGPYVTRYLLDTVKDIITVLDYLMAQTSAPPISGRKEFPDVREEIINPEEEVNRHSEERDDKKENHRLKEDEGSAVLRAGDAGRSVGSADR